MMVTKGLERTYEARDRMRAIIQAIEQNPTEQSQGQLSLLKSSLEGQEKTIQCVEEGKPFLASFYANAAEIYAAMDIHWYCIAAGALMGSAYLLEDLEGCDKMAMPADVCTVLRLSVYAVEAELVPRPSMIVAMITPCDGIPLLHSAVKNKKDWRDIPMFGADPPYWKDERSIDYYAGELKQMVSFLEEQTGTKLDMDRLREVITESNKQYALWAEYNELRRTVPCPHGSFQGTAAFGITQGALAGDPAGTARLSDMVADAEERVRAKKGWLENERIRLFWFDLRPTWASELTPWLEKEWGAVVVMDMFGYCPYTLVDTSTEDSMFKGLAKRYLSDTPMVRQARGLADQFTDDIVRVVRDYKIDCVLFPGHMGHKDGAASVGMIREVCRDIGVPLLRIGLDLFDPRYTTMDAIKDKISQFFTTMGLG